MPITIAIGNRERIPFRIESEGGVLKLPSIFVEPADVNVAAVSIKAIRVRIDGNPLGLIVLGSAYATNSDLKAYETPLKLTNRIEYQPFSITLKKKEVIPPGLYKMRVEVVYQQPPPFPGAKPGRDMIAIAERELEVGKLAASTLVKAGWRHRELTLGLNVAELVIHVENMPPDSAPSVSVLDPEGHLLPAVREAVKQHLAKSHPQYLGRHQASNTSIFEQKFDIPFNVPDTERAKALEKAPIEVGLRVALRKANEPAELAACTLTDNLALLVDFQENMFPGYPILDLGTTSTFALIYNSAHQTGFLPAEQEQTARASLRQWLDRKDGPFGMPEWQTVLANAARQLDDADRGADPEASVRNYLKRNPPRPSHTDYGVHRVLKAIELSAMAANLSTQFRLALRRELSDMYTRAFCRFPLEQQRLIGVEFDPPAATDSSRDPEGAIVAPIPSIVAVTSLSPFAVDIGHSAEAARRAAGVANPASLLTQFHSSPKIYYNRLGQEGETIEVSVNGTIAQVKPLKFLVASLKRLRERIETFRNSDEHLPKKKRFSKIVLPFPTSAHLSVRQQLLAAAREAGFDRPIAELDEALSAIVFYLVNPFGADKEMGLEAFRTSCRATPRGGQLPVEWRQNILLIDVGGGTTDIALIEVKLEDVQAKGAGDGSRGRYYRLIPKLLGATGKDQLAGNVLSLGVFHEVKRRIADAVLSALKPTASAAGAGKAATESPESTRLARLFQTASQVPAAFKDSAGDHYCPGSLLEHYLIHQLWIDRGDALASVAFRLADEVLPTAWKSIADEQERTAAARTFHMLWQIAENIKIKVFSGKTADSPADAIVAPEQIAALLGISAEACQRLGIGPVTIGRNEFWTAIDLPLREIAKLALDVTVNSLPANADGPGILDRIVLTGQTCRLGRVREVIKEAFQKECDSRNARLRWDPTCLIFQGEYAKQAAALGAAYARILIDDRVSPKFDVPLNGNILDIDIQNLFFFLQSGFYVRRARDAKDKEIVLSPGQAFREFDEQGVGHIRSDWRIDPSEMLYIDRFDFASDPGVPWGHYDCKLLADQLGVSLKQFQEETRVAVEADHRLIVSLLFCRGTERHYALPGSGAKIDVADALRLVQVIPPAAPPAGKDVAPALPNSEWMRSLGNWVVGVNVYSGFRNENLFRLSPGEFNKTLRDPADRTQRRGVESVDLPPRLESGRDKFYVRPNDASRDWIQIGELERPAEVAGRRAAARALLDDRGQLRVVPGELPLFFAKEDKDFLDPGIVLRKPLTSSTRSPDDLRDPFCGRH